MKKLTCLLCFLLCTLITATISAEEETVYVKAPYDFTIKRKAYKKRYGDITTNGRFAIFKIVFTNKDSEEHFINYDCFFLTGPDGVKYEVHEEATIVRQTYFEDWRIKDVDVLGFNNKTIKPNLQVSGFLIFEVPQKNDYQLHFRGYLK